MPRQGEPTSAQTSFLRSLRNPTGPKPQDWPSPSILRKWLRKPAFKAALQCVQDALHFQSDSSGTLVASTLQPLPR